MHESLETQDALNSYHQMQRNEMYRLLSALVQSPGDYMAHMRKYDPGLPDYRIR